jgi:hypothetical protein
LHHPFGNDVVSLRGYIDTTTRQGWLEPNV